MRYYLTILAIAGSFAVPAIAQAATPQQVLNSALANINITQPINAAGQISFRTKDVPYRSTTPVTEDFKIDLNVAGRTVPAQGAAEGTAGIVNVQGKTSGMTIPPTTNPASFDWKVASGKLYLRISQLSDAAINALQALGMDYSVAINKWIQSDVGTDANGVSSMLGIPNVQRSDVLALIKANALQVVNVEKKWKNGTDSMMRLRVRINPAIINKMMQADLAKVDKKANDAAAQRKAITKNYTDMRASAAKVSVAINVNATKNTVDRIESFIRTVDPLKACTTDKKGQQVCKTTGTRRTEVLAGISLKNGPANPVVAPIDAVTLDQLLNSVKQ
jgi:hypothetical protein